MKKILCIIAFVLIVFSVKSQDLYNYYTINNNKSQIELNIGDIYIFDLNYCLLSAIANDSNIAYSFDEDNSIVIVYPTKDWSFKEFQDYFNEINAKVRSEFESYLSSNKEKQGAIYAEWKANLTTDLYVFLFRQMLIENTENRDGNQSCATSEPFCTNDVITFHVEANPGGNCESGPYYGCLQPYIDRPPFWFHMRIRTAGGFTIRMTNSANVDIDYCCWGPFNDPVTPCPNQLTQAKYIDCGSSGSATENCVIPTSAQVGQYYILVITKYNQNTPTNISFQKVANSGTGETDCSIIEPFLTANSPCYGSNLVLEANVIEGAQYTWTGPDNQTHNGRTWTRQNATLNMAGLYTCHVVAGTQSGDESINVTVLPNVTANFNNSEAVVGQPVQFTGTETTNPSGHTNDINVRQWNFGDGATSTSANPTHTYTNPGDYQVSYHVAITGGNNGECGDTKTKTIQIRNEFAATVTSDNTSFCEGDATPNLTATATGGYGNYTYSWTSSPSCQIDYPSSATTTAHPALGNTTFTCTISDGHNTLTKSVTVTVNAIPDATITGPNPPHVNYNASTTLSVPQMSGATYEWSSEPANLIQSGQNTNQITTKNLTEPTTFHVTVSKDGCSGSSSMTLAVGDALYGNVVIVGQAELCSGETTSLMVNPSGGTEQYSFNWQPANMIEGSNTTQTITTKALTSSLSYTCTITDTDSHTYAATSPTVVVNPIPEAMAYVQESGNIYKTFHILAGNSVVLNMENIPGATYSWEPANLIREFLENNHRVARTYDLEENDNLVFTATVTSSSGCVNQDNVTIVVHQALDESYIAPSVDVICEDHEVTLTVNPSGGTGNYSYYWLPSSGGVYSDPYSQTTKVYPNSSNHTYRCIIADNGIDDKVNNWIEKSIDLAIYEKPSVNNTLIGQEYVIPGIDYMPYIYEYNIRVSSLHGYNIENAEYTWELFSYYDTPNHVSGTECTSTWQVFPDDLDKNKAYVSVDEYGNALLRCTITTECGSTKSEKFIYTEDYNQGQSVDEINYDKMVSVFPNPSNGEVYIGYNEKLVSKDIVISIYSYNGMLIDQIKANTDTNVTHYSMNDMSNGLYIVKITGNDFVVTKKFVLNK
jgi:PKD repeat protein